MRGQASDQANRWAGPAPATPTDKSTGRHAYAARSNVSHVKITSTGP
jgi:hypothetical protein